MLAFIPLRSYCQRFKIYVHNVVFIRHNGELYISNYAKPGVS